MQETSYLEGRGDLLENMRRFPAFQTLSTEQLEMVLSLSKLRRYRPEEPIIEEGTLDSWMYFIISGTVSVEKRGQQIGEIEGAGAVFGEMGVIDWIERSASVVAQDETLCLAVDVSFLDRMDLADKAACYAALYRVFVHILAERLRKTSEALATANAKLEIYRS